MRGALLSSERMVKPTNELGTIFHNREVSLDSSVSPHFLLVRFAWAIFPLVVGMFGTSHKRLVRVKTKEGDVTETDIEIEGRIILDGFEEKKSGKKRKYEQEEEPAEELETLSISSAESDHGQKAAPEYPSLKVSDGTSFNPEITTAHTTIKPGLISTFDQHIMELKRRALLAQRPHKPELICCDYEACDRASDLNLPYTICYQCLGEEFRVMPEVAL